MRVGRSVDRVHDGEKSGRPVPRRPRFLGEDRQSGAVQDGKDRGVGRQVQTVLTGPGTRRAPVPQPVECEPGRADRVVEHSEQPILVHEFRTLPPSRDR